MLDHAERWGTHVRCHQSKNDTNYQVAIVGDSHAEQLFYGIAESFPEMNVIYLIQGDLPFKSNPKFEYILNYVLGSQSIKTVILTAFWFGRLDISKHKVKLEETISTLVNAGKEVVLTDDVHSFNFDPTICKTKRRLALIPNQCKETNLNWTNHRNTYFSIIEDIAMRQGASFIETSQFLRDSDGNYTMAKNDLLLYRDRHHLNINGSKLIGARIRESGQLKFESK
jgi:hypothetical protein